MKTQAPTKGVLLADDRLPAARELDVHVGVVRNPRVVLLADIKVRVEFSQAVTAGQCDSRSLLVFLCCVRLDAMHCARSCGQQRLGASVCVM